MSHFALLRIKINGVPWLHKRSLSFLNKLSRNDTGRACKAWERVHHGASTLSSSSRTTAQLRYCKLDRSGDRFPFKVAVVISASSSREQERREPPLACTSLVSTFYYTLFPRNLSFFYCFMGSLIGVPWRAGSALDSFCLEFCVIVFAT